MGQYFKPILLSEDSQPLAWVYSHDIKTKMECRDGSTYMAGHGLKLMEHSWLRNKFVQTIENLLVEGGAWYKKPLVWAGDYADEEETNELNPKGENLYRLAGDEIKIKPRKRNLPAKFRYIVNHTTKEFVDKFKYKDKNGWIIHPLPLLTCEGNGSGGGDFYGADENGLVGSWARHIISIDNHCPVEYTELIFDLVE